MILSTKNYSMFKYRDDNRSRICPTHVSRLMKSIAARNLLEMRPIAVNAQYEVIDGQHRLEAAKKLGLMIYYEIKADLGASDIVLMNVAKAWNMADYFNFFLKNHYPEYMKLNAFMKEHGIQLNVAMDITMGAGKKATQIFKDGEYKFIDEGFTNEFELCWETVSYIKKLNGASPYLTTSRFWRAVLKLVRHGDFDAAKWRNNLKRMINRVTMKATTQEYVEMLLDIYNWRNHNKIKLDKEIEE